MLDGSSEGLLEGFKEGSTDGATEGSSDGFDDGSTDGIDDGSMDGSDEGKSDGSDEGGLDGCTDGSLDGDSVGQNSSTMNGGALFLFKESEEKNFVTEGSEVEIASVSLLLLEIRTLERSKKKISRFLTDWSMVAALMGSLLSTAAKELVQVIASCGRVSVTCDTCKVAVPVMASATLKYRQAPLEGVKSGGTKKSTMIIALSPDVLKVPVLPVVGPFALNLLPFS